MPACPLPSYKTDSALKLTQASYGQMDGQMDGQTDGQTYRFCLYFTGLVPLWFPPGQLPRSYGSDHSNCLSRAWVPMTISYLWATGYALGRINLIDVLQVEVLMKRPSSLSDVSNNIAFWFSFLFFSPNSVSVSNRICWCCKARASHAQSGQTSLSPIDLLISMTKTDYYYFNRKYKNDSNNITTTTRTTTLTKTTTTTTENDGIKENVESEA